MLATALASAEGEGDAGFMLFIKGQLGIYLFCAAVVCTLLLSTYIDSLDGEARREAGQVLLYVHVQHTLPTKVVAYSERANASPRFSF